MNLKKRLIARYKTEGLAGLAYKTAIVPSREIKNFLMPVFLNIFRKKKFNFNGEKLSYLYHRYNTTWVNERIVEIPIAMSFIEKYKGKRILEIGNVLNHYFSFSHDIVDKYETVLGVINEDAVDFQPDKKYDLIVTISTMEHVGWDEEPRQPEKILKAFENLFKNCLSSEGQIVATLPIGYNSFFDELLEKGKIGFSEEYFLKRISGDNNWQEVGREEAIRIKYGNPFSNANAIIIGIIKK